MGHSNNHSNLSKVSSVPQKSKCISSYTTLVDEVYEEAVAAIREEAHILAGLGLRATIEAICNDLKITGRNLEVRISHLASQGYVSVKDAARLHGIRFLGNDAAHEITKPEKRQIEIALKIVDHFISTIYILSIEADKALDTAINTFEEFRSILSRKLRNFATGDELPLAAYFGKDVRRLLGGLSTLEAELIARINSGENMGVTLGKIDVHQFTPTALQHFIKQ